ncbi:unnamed protein product [Rotaria sp. Silwood1]|nr:unnamed protein product [Rotaria sp. Silwood1]
MCDRFNLNSYQRDIHITIDPGYSEVAYVSGRIIVISAKWLRDNPRYDPIWLVAGIADYTRWKFGINNPAASWWLPNFDPSQHYTNAYGVTTLFLA